MNDKMFMSLPEDIPTTGMIGDMFLTKTLARQKTEKKKGDSISYYGIISVRENGNIEYMMYDDILE